MSNSLKISVGKGFSILFCLCIPFAMALEPVRVSEDGRGFVLADSKKPFRVWGVNYDHDTHGENGRLLEDYWETEWNVVEEDFQEIHALGANVVRIHLQFAKFMDSATHPNLDAIERLKRLLQLAEVTGLYLDLTGLGCYHKQDVPDWYDSLSESERWEAQAVFWKSVARTCRESNAVFCYDLMNEPLVSGKPSDGWLAGELGGKHFVQRLTLTSDGRTGPEIAKAWVERMTKAIRAEDSRHLITVGVIPWAMVWPNAKPVFYSPEIAPLLDFVSVHFYPEKGKVQEALEALKVYDIGKPLVIEEMFPLKCGFEEMDSFIRQSEPIVEGWMSFYWGKTIEDYESAQEQTMANAIMAKWLKYFKEQSQTYSRANTPSDPEN